MMSGIIVSGFRVCNKVAGGGGEFEKDHLLSVRVRYNVACNIILIITHAATQQDKTLNTMRQYRPRPLPPPTSLPCKTRPSWSVGEGGVGYPLPPDQT